MAITEKPAEDRKVSSQTPPAMRAEEPHKQELLEQFYLTLNVKYMAAPPRVERSVVHEKLDGLFAKKEKDHSWRDAY